MLELSDDLIFAYGGRRVCFVYPGDQSRCVKVFGVNGDPVKRRRQAVWYKKLRPLYYFDDNKREWASFKCLMKHDAEIWHYFPRCYGLVPTTRGVGIVTDLIRDNDGEVSVTLADYASNHGRTEALMDALNQFYDVIRRNVVITRDILDHNLVVQKTDDGLRIVMIDGFGSSEVLPISSWFAWVGKRKIERKIERFKQRYDY